MHLILLLFLITNIFAQSGNPRTQGEGVSNYQIQATTPTANPTTGNQYLYNANNILSTKDSAGTVNRVSKEPNNILSNPDFEQSLDYYTSTVGTTVINTATPLFGKQSANFDATDLNDFISTIPYLIPIGLQGQNCMGSLVYSGGDANLTMRIMNADGTIVGTKILAAVTNPTPAFIVFNCPAGTATVNQRTLRIDVIQNGAISAALATLDSFYLGRFESNTMTVQEQPQQYLWNGGDFTGNFAFPAPTKAVNDKTLFNYAGTTLTVLKPSILNFYVIQANYSGAGSVSNTISLNCIISGVSTNINGVPTHISNSGSNQVFTGIGYGILSTGDTCTINSTRSLAVTNSTVNITATPLPQLATIVNTNTPRAGFWGSKTWNGFGGCFWARTSNQSFADFSPIAACGSSIRTLNGNAIADTANDGQLPQIKFSSMKKGYYKFSVTGSFGVGVASQDCQFRVSNGTYSSNNGKIATQAITEFPSMVFELSIPVDLVNPTFGIQATGSSNNYDCRIIANNANMAMLQIVASYEPDLSDPYSIPELYAALPPQVINSSGKIWRTESCYITNNGTAAMASSSCNTWVQSLSRTAIGAVSINFIAGTFSSMPVCTCSSQSNICQMGPTLTTTNAAFTTNFIYTGGNQDYNFFLNCQGFK